MITQIAMSYYIANGLLCFLACTSQIVRFLFMAGAVYLSAPTVSLQGAVTASGGIGGVGAFNLSGCGGNGGEGRIRIGKQRFKIFRVTLLLFVPASLQIL